MVLFISFSQTCHIGRKRTYKEEEQANIDSRIQDFLDQHSSIRLDENIPVMSGDEAARGADKSATCGGDAFEPREAIEKVRNCSQVDKAVRDDIVEKVSKALLRSGDLLGFDDGSVTSKGIKCSQWNYGGLYDITYKTQLGLAPKYICDLV